VIAGVVGLGMILFGLYLINAATRPASGHSDDGTPEVAGLESLDCSLPYKSVYSLAGLGSTRNARWSLGTILPKP